MRNIAARQAAALDQVRAFIQREGRTPTAREMGLGGEKRPDLPHGSTVSVMFGGLPKFWAQLGVETRKPGERINPVVYGRRRSA